MYFTCVVDVTHVLYISLDTFYKYVTYMCTISSYMCISTGTTSCIDTYFFSS